MRRLIALVLVLAAVVAATILTTGDARRADGVDVPAKAAAHEADEQRALAETRLRADEGLRAVSAEGDARDSERRPARTPSSEIAGVVRHDDGEPAVHAIVGLFAPARENDGNQSPFAPQELRDRSGAEELRLVHTWTRTDAAGRFRFPSAAPGRWIVRADLGPLLACATPLFAVEPGMSRSDLVLTLPPAAWLEGRLIAPEGAAFDSVCLELRTNGETTLGRWMPLPRTPEIALRCRLEADGKFRLGPAEAGLHTVGLVLDASLRTTGRPSLSSGNVVSLLDLYLPAGETHRDVDLRGGFPGSISLSVTVHESSAAKVAILSGQMRVWAEPIGSESIKEIVGGLFRTGATVELGPLPPGEWRVLVQLPRCGPWSWPVSDAIRVRPAERVQRTLDLEIAAAIVELLDASTGEPLGKGFVEVGRRDDQGGLTSMECAVGPGGHTTFVLPPGDYMLTGREEGLDALADDPRAWVALTWEASGPSAAVLRVPR